MSSTDSSSEEPVNLSPSLSPPRKRRKKMKPDKTKMMVFEVFKWDTEEYRYPSIYLDDICECVAEKLGGSSCSVRNIVENMIFDVYKGVIKEYQYPTLYTKEIYKCVAKELGICRSIVCNMVETMIFDVYKCEIEEYQYPSLFTSKICKSVATKLGICSHIVCNIVNEHKQYAFASPKYRKQRKNTINALEYRDKQAIRCKLHDYFFKNEFPTIDKVLEAFNEDANLPNFKRRTLLKLLKNLKFKFQGFGRNSMLLESDEIMVWRREYLKKIKSYRTEGRKIYYLGETWINAVHTKSKKMVDSTVASSSQALNDGPSKELNNPSGKWLIACHIGSENGFLKDGMWAFQSEKSGDYHVEIDGQSFENWFETILPKLEPNSVIVLDNAPWHCRKKEEIPSTTCKKTDIQNWLTQKNISFEESMLKVELLRIVKQHKEKYNAYKIDEMAEKYNKTILRLPPYHRKLNPIELIWGDVKIYVAQNHTSHKFSEMSEHFTGRILRVTAKSWQNYIKLVKDKVEPKMWELDNIIEAHVERNINVRNTSSSSSESETE